jgi:hypothetical protein
MNLSQERRVAAKERQSVALDFPAHVTRAINREG